MSATPTAAGTPKHFDRYRWLVVCASAAALAYSAYRLPVERIDLRYLLLALMTVVASSRLSVQIPRFDTSVTVSDAFLFLTVLLYGGEPAVLLGAAEGVCSGLRASKSKKPVTVLFSAAVMTCSTFVTIWVLRFGYGSIVGLPHQVAPVTLAAAGTMALTHYAVNTGLVAAGLALKTNQPFWQTWSRNYLWSSVTYFGGAAAAVLAVAFSDRLGLYGLAVVASVILVLYFTYSKYLDDIKATAAQAERAERERAEAERARAEAEHRRAEQAERHVVELNRYITQLEQTGSELQQSREHFRHAAFHDSLTGLPNRAMFAEQVGLAVGRARRHDGYKFAVLFLDLDRFKYINDSLGHSYGDKLLSATARRLESCLREGDTVARFGGDEFAVLVGGIEGVGDAVRVAEKIQERLGAQFNFGGNEAFTTASIGIALSSPGYEDPDDILRDADTAMYRAKDGGKARHEVFDQAMHSRAVARLRLENDLRRAIERGEFRVVFQPIMDLVADRLDGFEALVRWDHPERGIVSPAEFIPLSEETGLIVQVGSWVLEESCRQMREWQLASAHAAGLTVSVNLSAKQLAQPDLVEQIKQLLHRTGLDPRGLKLEITESVVMESAEKASGLLSRLRELGVRLSIDDFGTGYSSLSYLHQLPVDTLKIDRSFVARMGEKDQNVEIVRTIAALAGNLGMSVIAEGVETETQKAQLKRLGCRFAQGYLFSPPVDAAAAGALIRRGRTANPADWPGALPREEVEQISGGLVM